jgi:RNA polymerase sigma-70 factor (ECF subfamily)
VSGRYDADVALARRCAAGDEAAWETFVLEYRPILYRAADALEPGGGARELADSLYADLYGLRERAGERQSLFRYFEGRSSLGTWLRAVLAQRYVDRVRARRKLEPLPEDDRDDDAGAPASDSHDPAAEPHRHFLQLAFTDAIARLEARDRLRLGVYYVQELTLAQTGKLLKESEATASRQLARTRKVIRERVERYLRDEARLSEAAIDELLKAASQDPGELDLGALLAANADATPRKKTAQDRSK